jgi:hypothetical protein
MVKFSSSPAEENQLPPWNLYHRITQPGSLAKQHFELVRRRVTMT